MTRIISFFTLLLFLVSSCNAPNYTTIDGFTMGTTFHIVHDGKQPETIAACVDSVLTAIDNSLSVYNSQSLISQINRNETTMVDSLLATVFRRSKEIYEATGGAFDIASSPLFNAWGFGFSEKETITQDKIDSLKQFCGMHHVWLEGNRIVKNDPRVTLNANAIAKGFGVDVVAGHLEQMGTQNYLVEIGGEVRCKGKNRQGEAWRVGVDKPIDGNIFPGENMQAVLYLSGKALATSGNYRKYYEENGRKYGHTINPATGYPVLHSLLSATVIAVDCTTADAFATAFMVVGLDGAKELLAAHPELDAYLIYDENGQLKTFYTKGVKIQ